ncbi:hypothetical protein HO173_007087 [Letharia columbiana]|uniref:Uncharacterized protein n=1 Tax=Letharia columbiana TaxID=112416 RepID=A0A8H6L438_9LECA|nr:uncharacterized protein HO173_007087 [Letharia columbiana]KAF6234867.1 hypothetical protein HO173_007087 [Letharia columbiana]
MKIYCCDKYEICCYSNTNWLNDLEWDKLSLAVSAAALEDVRMDVLQWLAILRVGHLPAGIVRVIYDMVSKSKYQDHEDPWDKVLEQSRFSIMISASGFQYSPSDEIVSR